MPDGRKVLILTASMGGGHLQVSRELERRLRELEVPAAVLDILDLTPRWGRFVRWLYPTLVNRTPWLYDLIYRRFFLPTRSSAASLPGRMAKRRLARLVREEYPSLVVSTYHLAGMVAAELRAAGALPAPVVSFVTTFGVHHLWTHPGVDRYLCITDEAAEELSAVTAAPVTVVEPVVRPQFDSAGAPSRPYPKVSSNQRMVLVVAGALGLGDFEEAVRVIAAMPDWRPVAVCGGNDRLRERLEEIPGATVYGWVDDMASLMTDAYVVLDNAAGSTAKEALALGRPVITFRPISGHGRHDALMMAGLGLTSLVDDPADLPTALEELSDPTRWAARVAHGLALFGEDPAAIIAGWAGERTWPEVARSA